MPSIQDSANIDRSRLSPAAPATSGPTSIVAEAALGMSAFMHCPMPLMASTYDSLTRQYYGSRVPQTRLLPVQGGK
jgi:hypothetical protein